MNSSLIITDSLLEEFAAAMAAASGKWTGCDWCTQFGPTRLDLRDLHSSQANLMAQATAGSEAADWRDAVTWLKRVEQDASQAESEAQTATRLARSGKLRDALQCADRACAIEARYRKPFTWRPLRDAIEAALSKVDRSEPEGSPKVQELQSNRYGGCEESRSTNASVDTPYEATGQECSRC